MRAIGRCSSRPGRRIATRNKPNGRRLYWGQNTDVRRRTREWIPRDLQVRSPRVGDPATGVTAAPAQPSAQGHPERHETERDEGHPREEGGCRTDQRSGSRREEGKESRRVEAPEDLHRPQIDDGVGVDDGIDEDERQRQTDGETGSPATWAGKLPRRFAGASDRVVTDDQGHVPLLSPLLVGGAAPPRSGVRRCAGVGSVPHDPSSIERQNRPVVRRAALIPWDRGMNFAGQECRRQPRAEPAASWFAPVDGRR